MTFRLPNLRAALLIVVAVSASLALLNGCSCDHARPSDQPTHPAANDGKAAVRSPGPHQNG